MNNFLSLLIFTPLVGMVVILVIPARARTAIRAVAALTAGITAVMAVWLYYFTMTNPTSVGVISESSMLLVEKYKWVEAFGITYFVGIDGLSAPMIMLTPLLTFLAVFAAWRIEKGVKGFFALLLLLETSMLGVFCSLDFFLFYVFWELMLLPMYFLIGIWGGPRRQYAAIKFFLYTLVGSVLMLIAMIFLYIKTSPTPAGRTFDLFVMFEMLRGDTIPAHQQFWLWLALFIGFAIKVPIFPFHTWLPDAHVEAPTAISVILAGILLKMGCYGFLRFNFTLLAGETAREWANPVILYKLHITNWRDVLAILGVINIIYGGMVSMAQTDLKRLVAYSSVAHMGFVLLGFAAMTPMAMNGAILQMFNHGVSSAMLFLLAGVIYDRAHHRDINGFGGLYVRMPVYTGFATLAFFTSLGLPGLAGFVGEAFVLVGSWQDYPLYTAMSCFGVLITAAYFLWCLQRVFLGKLNPRYSDISDVNGREIFTLVPLGFLGIIFGVFPHLLINVVNGSASKLCELVTGGY